MENDKQSKKPRIEKIRLIISLDMNNPEDRGMRDAFNLFNKNPEFSEELKPHIMRHLKKKVNTLHQQVNQQTEA